MFFLNINSVNAIVIRHDRADSRYVIDAKRYPQLFFLQERREHKVCLATLISRRWAITAGHCIDDTLIGSTLAGDKTYPLTINNATYQAIQLVKHPDYSNGDYLEGVDLALIELDREVQGIPPLQLNRVGDEKSKIVTLLGWGYSGEGTTGHRYNDGKFRRAENTVEIASRWLRFSFDDPRLSGSTALNLEGIPGLGDSGGPALLETEHGMLLLGIAVGELQREGGIKQGLYGATEVYERIFRHLEWIDNVIGIQ